MAYELREGSGTLFINDKGDNPTRPDYRGEILLDGVVYELSGWIKPMTRDPSKRFVSLAGKLKPGSQPQGRPAQSQQRPPPPRREPLRPSPPSRDFGDYEDRGDGWPG